MKKNATIVICKADKSSTTVIWEKEDYIREWHRQLNGMQYVSFSDSHGKYMAKANWNEE